MHMTVPFLVFGKESEMSVIASLIIIRSSMKSSLSFSSDLEAPDYAVAVCAESIKKKKKIQEDQNRTVSLMTFSGPSQNLIYLRDHFISGDGTVFPHVHHFTYIYIAFHLSFYCPVIPSL